MQQLNNEVIKGGYKRAKTESDRFIRLRTI